MKPVTKHIIVELTGQRPGLVEVALADRDSRAVSCRLLENGAPWLIPEGAAIRVAYRLPDGTEGLYDTIDGSPAWEIAGNIVTVRLIDQIMAKSGVGEIIVVILGADGGQLATWPVRVCVSGNPAASLTVPENLPPYGAGFAGKIFFGGADGTITPLALGDGVKAERLPDGSWRLTAEGGGGVALDPTLTQSGKAADAKATGDEIKRVEKLIPSIDGLAKTEDIPKVPSWAMQTSKPTYTASEVGADPSGTAAAAVAAHNRNDAAHPALQEELKRIEGEIPDVSAFITRAVSDLVNYYTKSETYTRTEIKNLISAIPKFSIQVVSGLPTADISATTIYLVPAANETDLYAEYIYVNGAWEILGAQRVDLTGYALESWVTAGFQPKGDYLTEHQSLAHLLPRAELDSAINTALDQARDSGEFDGEPGHTPVPGVDYWTAADQEAIVQQVITALGTPVFGRVDEDCKITLSGELAAGKTYTFVYEDADGNENVIGTLEHGGVSYTNLADPTSADWLVGYRMSSGGEIKEESVTHVSNYIPVKAGDVVRVRGQNLFFHGASTGYATQTFYNENKERIAKLTFNGTSADIYGSHVGSDGEPTGDFVYAVASGAEFVSGDASQIAYVRFSGRLWAGYTKEDVIITVNQEIPV